MAGERIILAELDIDVKKLIQKASEIKTSIVSLTDEQKKLEQQGEKGSAQWVRNDAELKRLASSYRGVNTAIQAQVSEGGKLLTQNEAIIASVDRLNMSEGEYRENNKQLLKLRKDLLIPQRTAFETQEDYTAAMKEYGKTLDAINGKLNENNDWIKENVSEYEKQKIAIGQYKEKIIEAANELNPFNGGLAGFISRSKEAGGAKALFVASFAAMRASVAGLTASLWAFMKTPFGIAITVLAGIAYATKEWVQYNREVAKANRETAAITKLSGDALNSTRANAKSLADTFDVDFKQILEAAKSYVNAYHVSWDVALDKIQEGLIKSQGNNDKYLDSVKEFPKVLVDAGYNIDEFQSLINTGIDTSMYEKLPDAIKEFSLAITEQTPAARDALNNAFGEEFTGKLFNGIKDGSITVKAALEQISAQAKAAGINVQQQQQLTADLFKGAGEDAGGAVKIFDAVNKSIENQKKPLTEAEQAMQDYAQAQRDTAAAQDMLLQSDGYAIWETNVKTSLQKIKQGFYEFLITITNSREELEKMYKTGAEDKGVRDWAKNSIVAFEDYISRRKKSLGDNYTFERVQEEYLSTVKQQLAKETDSYKKRTLKAEIEAIENYRDKTVTANQDVVDSDLITMNKRLAALQAAGKDTYVIEEAILLKRMALYDKSSAEYAEAENSLTALRLKNAQTIADKQKEDLEEYAQKLQLQLQLLQQVDEKKFKTYEAQLDQAAKVRDASLKVAKAEYDAAVKGEKDLGKIENSKLQLKITNNQAIISYNEQVTNIVIANAEKEYNTILAVNKSRLDNNKFLTDEMVKNETDRINTIAKAENDRLQVQFDNEIISAEELKAAKDDIEAGKNASLDELNRQRTDAENNRRLTDIENRRQAEQLGFEEDMILEQERLDIERAQEVAAAEKTGADVALINAKYDKYERDLERQKQEYKLNMTRNTLGQMTEIFGRESKAGKAFAATMALIDTYVAAQKAYTSQIIVGDPSSIIRAVIAAGAATATGLRNVAKIQGIKEPKFESGGLMELGGNRHSAGGTKFLGSDGTRFEAEQGELIGVMNRNAARHFMAFNNQYGGAGSIHSPSAYLATGGVVTVRENAGLDIDALAAKIGAATAEANASLPAPRVAVDDIARVGTKMVTAEQRFDQY